MKNALITGASRGIGRAIAERFAREGYGLYLVCERNMEALEAFAKRLYEEYGTVCRTAAFDIGDSKSVNTFCEQIEDVDVLVNNAGVSHIGLLQDMSDVEWQRVISSDLTGCFNMCRAVIPILLKKKQGSIINISSVWGSVGASMEVAYSAAKGGMDALTKGLAKELAPSGIAVNAIACGLIDTDMNKCFDEEELTYITEEIPAGRMGRPEEIAEIVYGVANFPAYMTGQIIKADGGWK